MGWRFPASGSEAFSEYGAVKLFIESARRVQPDLRLGAEGWAAIVRICRLLDGIPLAILLASAWIEVLSPLEIEAEISQSLDFLETDWRDLPDRQRSMRAVFEHSWRSLTQIEQDAFQQLSVFRGDFSRQAAHKVAGASLRTLMGLADKSLIHRSARGCYEVHQLLRQYATEILDQSSATSIEDLSERHSIYYLAFLGQREADLKSAHQGEALTDIEADIENIGLAWEEAIAHHRLDRLSQAAESLGRFYEWRGRYQEGEAAFQSIVDGLGEDALQDKPDLLATILIWQALFKHYLGQTEPAHTLLRQSQTVLDDAGLADCDNRLIRAFMLQEMGRLVADTDREQANRLYEASLVLYKECGDRWGRASVLHLSGRIARNTANYGQSKQLLEESLALRQALGDQKGVADTLSSLGMTLMYLGDLKAAENLIQESIAIHRAMGSRPGLAQGLADLSTIFETLGRFDGAYAYNEEALMIFTDLGNQVNICFESIRFGFVNKDLGRYQEAWLNGQAALRIARDIEDTYLFGFGCWLLSCVALVRDDYLQAEQLSREGIAALKIVGQRVHWANTLVCLGWAAYKLNKLAEGIDYLSEAIQILIDAQATADLGRTFPMIALLLAEQGKQARAAELYALASSRDPLVVRSRWFKDMWGQPIERIINTLPTEVRMAAEARGRSGDLWQTAEELLAELSVDVREQWSKGDEEKSSLLSLFPGPSHNLPPQPTPFIGRETELAQLADLLAEPDLRLITIVGPGGMGKTRLALAVAEAQLSQSRFIGGIFFVSLAHLSESEAIIPAIAEAVGYPFQGDGRSPQQQLLDYFREKQQLLILDNFEHLLEGVEFVADLLQAAMKVKVLTTSRERLQLHQEQLYPLRGLAFSATRSAAIDLFVQTARRSRPNFAVAPDDLPHLATICKMVEGMPLGLELAASWVDMLSIADIGTEIQRSLDFLETEMRNVPERHRSMRAVFDASWQQLNETEQAVFAQLSVFRGGFTREAAEEVAGTSLRILAALANKSLLHFSQKRDRYEIHGLLRQYAAEKLDASGLISELRERHAAYYCALLQRRNPELKGPRPQIALAEIGLELDNARAAWKWAVDQGQVERLDQAMDSLGMFFDWRARYPEGEAIYRLAVEKLQHTVSGDGLRILSKLLTWLALFSHEMGQNEQADQLEQQSLTLLDGPALAGQETRQARAFLMWVRGERMAFFDLEEAKRLFKQGLALCRELGDRWGTAHALHALSHIANEQGPYAEMKRLAEESLAIRQELDDKRGVTQDQGTVARFFADKEQFEEAEQLRRQVLVFYQEMGDHLRTMRSADGLGETLNDAGKFAESHCLVQEILSTFHTLEDQRALGDLKDTLGRALLHLGRYEEASTYFRQSLTHYQEAYIPRLDIPLSALGEVALTHEAYNEAQRLLQESIASLRQRGGGIWLSWLLIVLGYAEWGLGNNFLAQQHLAEGVGIALKQETIAKLRYALPLAALLLADQGQKERAIELYALALQSPFVANSRWHEAVAGRHIAAAAECLPPEVVAAAEARGRARDLWATAEELLEELTETAST